MKIIGIKTLEQIEKDYEKIEKDIKTENDKISNKNFCIFLIAIPIGCIIAFIFNICCYFGNNSLDPLSIQSFPSYIVICLLSVLISVGFMKPYRTINEVYWHSLVYQYFSLAETQNILKHDQLCKNEECWLLLDLEDKKTKEISYKKIGPFAKKEQSDINEPVFDLEQKVAYIPYTEKEVIK